MRARRADFAGSIEPRVGIGWSRHPSHRTESVDRGMFMNVALAFNLIWKKDNSSPLLQTFVAQVGAAKIQPN